MISLNVLDRIQGFIVYRGPSRLNGKRIVAILTGLLDVSENVKTGSMLQIYILRDRISPIKALWHGEDEAVCGDCYHRVVNGAGTCYVNPLHGPNPIYRALKHGKYPRITLQKAAQLISGHDVRLGAYGDPVAVPIEVWEQLLVYVNSWTGYTHQWRSKLANGYNKFCMASVETELAAKFANKKGWRTFRIRENEKDLLLKNEIICPASIEAGKRLTL